MGGSVRHALTLSFLVPAIAAQQAPNTPQGIYAVVNVEDDVNTQQKAHPAITQAGLDAFFDKFYLDLLNNPAVAGLTLQVHMGHAQSRSSERRQPVLVAFRGRRLQPGLGVGCAESWRGSENGSAHCDAGVSVAPVAARSAFQLRRAVSEARSDASGAVRKGDLHGVQRRRR
jgi:hypothetical protein